jgi:hypothetical protein
MAEHPLWIVSGKPRQVRGFLLLSTQGRASQQQLAADVCFGSGAGISRLLSNVRFTPQSGHIRLCPLSANA